MEGSSGWEHAAARHAVRWSARPLGSVDPVALMARCCVVRLDCRRCAVPHCMPIAGSWRIHRGPGSARFLYRPLVDTVTHDWTMVTDSFFAREDFRLAEGFGLVTMSDSRAAMTTSLAFDACWYRIAASGVE